MNNNTFIVDYANGEVVASMEFLADRYHIDEAGNLHIAAFYEEDGGKTGGRKHIATYSHGHWLSIRQLTKVEAGKLKLLDPAVGMNDAQAIYSPALRTAIRDEIEHLARMAQSNIN